MTIPKAPLDEGEAAAEQEAGEQPPAGPQPALGGDQAQGLVLPQADGERQRRVAERGHRPDLDRLGPRPDVAQQEHAAGGAAHQHDEGPEPGAERDARQQARAEGEDQGRQGVVRDRQDHRGEGDRDQLGPPGPHRDQPAEPQGGHGQDAERRDPVGVPGDPGLVAVDVGADQGVERPDQHEERGRAFEPIEPVHRVGRGLLVEPEELQLILGDGHVLLDEQLAPREGVVVVPDPVLGTLARLGGQPLLVVEGGRLREPTGDEVEQRPAQFRRVEIPDEVLGERAVGTDQALRQDAVAIDEEEEVAVDDLDHRPRLLVQRQEAAPEDAVADDRGEGLGDGAAEVLATLGRVARLAEVVEGLLGQVPRLEHVGGEGRGRLATGVGDGLDEVLEQLLELEDRGRVVGEERRDFPGRLLPEPVGLHQVEALELGDVDAEVARGPLADPEGEGGAGAGDDHAAEQDRQDDRDQARDAAALPGEAELPRLDRVGPAQLGARRFLSSFAGCHSRASAGHAPDDPALEIPWLGGPFRIGRRLDRGGCTIWTCVGCGVSPCS